ncbi:uncharacterized protein METZ01_LOCUS309179 [marine metagenome]|uniref:Uncharacterized protein n=1 Tax=marine metagenome TaxID=408172 RepID=A0A382N7K9_9ZZZZ
MTLPPAGGIGRRRSDFSNCSVVALLDPTLDRSCYIMRFVLSLNIAA